MSDSGYGNAGVDAPEEVQQLIDDMEHRGEWKLGLLPLHETCCSPLQPAESYNPGP